MTVRDLIDLVYDSLVDFIVAMTQTRDRSTTGGVEHFLAVLKEEITAFSADGFLGNETSVSVENTTA